MRLTLITLRGGTVWDDAPPPGTEAAVARHLPTGRPVAAYRGAAANRVAADILRDLLALPPAPQLIIFMSHLQVIERREGSQIVILA